MPSAQMTNYNVVLSRDMATAWRCYTWEQRRGDAYTDRQTDRMSKACRGKINKLSMQASVTTRRGPVWEGGRQRGGGTLHSADQSCENLQYYACVIISSSYGTQHDTDCVDCR